MHACLVLPSVLLFSTDDLISQLKWIGVEDVIFVLNDKCKKSGKCIHDEFNRNSG